MAIVNKQTLKGYFEQGDIPTQGQYMNLIDSMFNLTETGTQIIQGTFSASSAEIDYLSLKKAYLPGIGVDDAKIGTTFVVGKSLEVMGSMNVNATGSDAGNLTVEGEVSTGTLSVTGGNISASNAIVTKNISASSNISGSKINVLSTADDILIAPGDDFGFNETTSFFQDSADYSVARQTDA